MEWIFLGPVMGFWIELLIWLGRIIFSNIYTDYN